jgi:iron complex transport system permease protein
MVDNKQVTEVKETNIAEEKRKYKKLIARRGLFLTFSLVLLFVVIGVAIVIGSANFMTFLDAYKAIFAKFFPSLFQVESRVDFVVWGLRLPRILLAVLAGAVFAMGGCITQVTLRNPVATPYTLGVSTGAGLGATIAIVLGVGILGGQFLIIGNAFVFSLIPIFAIIMLMRRKSVAPQTIILVGLAMSYIFNACTTILQYFANDNALSSAVFWMMGDLSTAAWWQLPYVLGVLVLCLIVNLKLSRDLNILKMGDDTAKSLGVEVERTRKIALVVTCLSTATVASFTGPIGFICLVAPHICRAIIGGDERYLIVSSAVFGGILLLVADILARQLIPTNALPVGAITAFLGGPMLLYLLIKRKSNR